MHSPKSERLGGKQPGAPRLGIRSLPLHLWPAADQKTWEAACCAGARLKRGGAACRFKPVTRNDLARRYGYFLDFLARSGRLQTCADAAAQVTRDNVEPYVLELKARVSSVTVYGSIVKLRRIARLIAPHQDFGWLAEREADLRHEMRPQSKSGRLVLMEKLIEAGLMLMTEVETSNKISKLARARLFRNGLMIALLGYCPIRLKNFAALELGRSMVQIKGVWWIVLSAPETKERRSDERPVPALLNGGIQRYLRVYRPILQKGGSSSRALWLSSQDGSAMKYSYVTEVVTETTRLTLGVKVSPHLFRMSAASTAATYAGATPHLASALLHHSQPTVTQEHYNRASSMGAAQAYAAITEGYRRG
jgi:integrase